MPPVKSAMELEYLRAFKPHRRMNPALREPVPLPHLIPHMAMFYSDYQLDHDVDAVLSCCADDADREAVDRYVKARRNALGFHPWLDKSNNHNRIPPKELAEVTAGVASQTRCEDCGNQFTHSRASARFCSAACRKRHSRRACHANASNIAGQA